MRPRVLAGLTAFALALTVAPAAQAGPQEDLQKLSSAAQQGAQLGGTMASSLAGGTTIGPDGQTQVNPAGAMTLMSSAPIWALLTVPFSVLSSVGGAAGELLKR